MSQEQRSPFLTKTAIVWAPFTLMAGVVASLVVGQALFGEGIETDGRINPGVYGTFLVGTSLTFLGIVEAMVFVSHPPTKK